jgi:hypothetical protein
MGHGHGMVWSVTVTGRSKALVVALVVFALAIGVLIGSGPLRAGLGAGSSQAEDLARARAEAEESRGLAEQGLDFADAVGPGAVATLLDGHVVAFVRTADASDDDLAAATDRIAEAGATVGSTVALTDEWAAEDRGPFRDALAEQVTLALPEPPQGATSAQVLADALAQALAGADEFDLEAQERAETLWALLTQASLVAGERSTDADLFVLVTPGGDVADLANAFQSASSGTVVALTGPDAGEVGGASSVTRAASFYGAWAVTAALIESLSGRVGAYDASDADELIGGLSPAQTE